MPLARFYQLVRVAVDREIEEAERSQRELAWLSWQLVSAGTFGGYKGDFDSWLKALGANSLRRSGTSRGREGEDRKSTRLNSSHVATSYAVFCLKKRTKA